MVFGGKQLLGHHEIVETRAEEIRRQALQPLEEGEVAVDPAPAAGDPGEDSGVTQACAWEMETMGIPRSPRRATADGPSVSEETGVSRKRRAPRRQYIPCFVPMPAHGPQ